MYKNLIDKTGSDVLNDNTSGIIAINIGIKYDDILLTILIKFVNLFINKYSFYTTIIINV